MPRRILTIVLAALVIAPALAQTRQTAATYFPERFDWQHKKPQDVGMNPALVEEAVQTAVANETTGPKDMKQFLTNSFGKEPGFKLVGPIKDRGPASGIITRHGYIVAEWGEPHRADITNSVTKTFLTTVVGWRGSAG
jgi:hypothetical protein